MRGKATEVDLRGGFLVFNGGHTLEVLGLEDLPAIHAADVVDAISAGDHFRPGVIADGFHRAKVIPLILFKPAILSRPGQGARRGPFADALD